jgi:hypothetical protein
MVAVKKISSGNFVSSTITKSTIVVLNLFIRNSEEHVNIYYDKDIDYSEIFYKKVENYSEDIADSIIVFKSEENDEIFGCAFKDASAAVFKSHDLPARAKVAFLLKMTMEKHVT